MAIEPGLEHIPVLPTSAFSLLPQLSSLSHPSLPPSYPPTEEAKGSVLSSNNSCYYYYHRNNSYHLLNIYLIPSIGLGTLYMLTHLILTLTLEDWCVY